MLEDVERGIALRNDEPVHQTARCACTCPKLRAEPPDRRKPPPGTQIERRCVRTLSRPYARGGHRGTTSADEGTEMPRHSVPLPVTQSRAVLLLLLARFTCEVAHTATIPTPTGSQVRRPPA